MFMSYFTYDNILAEANWTAHKLHTHPHVVTIRNLHPQGRYLFLD